MIASDPIRTTLRRLLQARGRPHMDSGSRAEEALGRKDAARIRRHPRMMNSIQSSRRMFEAIKRSRL